jgi:hypothetical protein
MALVKLSVAFNRRRPELPHILGSVLLWQTVYLRRRLTVELVGTPSSDIHSNRLLASILNTSMYGRFSSHSLVRVKALFPRRLLSLIFLRRLADFLWR